MVSIRIFSPINKRNINHFLFKHQQFVLCSLYRIQSTDSACTEDLEYLNKD